MVSYVRSFGRRAHPPTRSSMVVLPAPRPGRKCVFLFAVRLCIYADTLFHLLGSFPCVLYNARIHSTAQYCLFRSIQFQYSYNDTGRHTCTTSGVLYRVLTRTPPIHATHAALAEWRKYRQQKGVLGLGPLIPARLHLRASWRSSV